MHRPNVLELKKNDTYIWQLCKAFNDSWQLAYDK